MMRVMPRRPATRTSLSAASLAVVVAVGVGCGSAPRPELTSQAARQLHEQLATARAAARGSDSSSALAALSDFSRLVAREARAGRLSGAQDRALRTGITRARRRLELDAAAATPATSAPAPVPAPLAPPGKGHGNSKGHEKSKAHGSGRGENGQQ